MSEALWVLGRGTGVVALVLLTVTMVLGVVVRSGRPLGAMPRFGVVLTHRNVTLLAVAFTVVHVVTLLADPYAQLTLVDTVVPFLGARRPFALGLGTLAVDALAAITVTALARRAIGVRAFKAVHWAAYGLWPVALLHSVLDGTDGTSGWLLVLAAASTLAVLGAVAWRLTPGFVERSTRRARLVQGARRVGATPAVAARRPDEEARR